MHLFTKTNDSDFVHDLGNHESTVPGGQNGKLAPIHCYRPQFTRVLSSSQRIYTNKCTTRHPAALRSRGVAIESKGKGVGGCQSPMKIIESFVYFGEVGTARALGLTQDQQPCRPVCRDVEHLSKLRNMKYCHAGAFLITKFSSYCIIAA